MGCSVPQSLDALFLFMRSLHHYQNLCLSDIEGEIWADIPGYFGFYQASNMGRIKSVERPITNDRWKRRKVTVKIIKQSISANYLQFTAITYIDEIRIKKSVLVHRLVCMAFNNRTDSGRNFVNHKNCDKLDNRSDNLEWCTSSENLKHAYENGLIDQKGDKNNASKLTEDQVRDILSSDLSSKEMAIKYDVHLTHIRVIRKKKSWGHINI